MLIEKFSQYSFILDRTARKVKQYAQATFTQQDFDITIDQWAVIKILYNADPMTQKELSEESSKDQPTLTRIIDLLIKKKSCTPNRTSYRPPLFTTTVNNRRESKSRTIKSGCCVHPNEGMGKSFRRRFRPLHTYFEHHTSEFGQRVKE